MNKIKQRIGDLRCEITAITTQREPLDAMQQLELFGLKERLRELEAFVSDEDEDMTPYTKVFGIDVNSNTDINLRDQLALHALSGLLSNTKYFNPGEKHEMIKEHLIFERAYEMADGMLEARRNNNCDCDYPGPEECDCKNTKQ